MLLVLGCGDNELFSPPRLAEDFWVVAVFASSQLGPRVNGLKVLEEARVGRKVWKVVGVVAARDLGVVELLGLPAGRRLSVKEKGNKLGEGAAVAWLSIQYQSSATSSNQNDQKKLFAWSARTYGIPVGRRLLVVGAKDVVE